MPTLFLRCRSCGAEFPSGISVAESALRAVTMNGLSHTCPNCRRPDQYFTPDYHLPAELIDRRAPTPPPRASAARALRKEEQLRMSAFGVHS